MNTPGQGSMDVNDEGVGGEVKRGIEGVLPPPSAADTALENADQQEPEVDGEGTKKNK